MPAAGKSTVGVVLAKRLARRFIDTDLEIQDRTGRSLQDIIASDGARRFRAIEEAVVRELRDEGGVIATGGSVVYSDAAMEHLRRLGRVVFLDAPLADLLRRIGDLDRRGLVRRADQSFGDLYAERLPLYRRWADVIVDVGGLTVEEAAKRVLEALRS